MFWILEAWLPQLDLEAARLLGRALEQCRGLSGCNIHESPVHAKYGPIFYLNMERNPQERLS